MDNFRNLTVKDALKLGAKRFGVLVQLYSIYGNEKFSGSLFSLERVLEHSVSRETIRYYLSSLGSDGFIIIEKADCQRQSYKICVNLDEFIHV